MVNIRFPRKISVIGGISRDGATDLLVFDGKMDGPDFESLMTSFICYHYFIVEKMPNFHIFHMDNAPQHTAAKLFRFLENNNISHRQYPAQ